VSLEAKAEEGVIQGFDYRVTIRNPKTGELIKEQPYKRYVSEIGGEYLERDGKFYATNGDEIPDPKADAARALAKADIAIAAEKMKPEVTFTKK
jgi:hypothetical protein